MKLDKQFFLRTALALGAVSVAATGVAGTDHVMSSLTQCHWEDSSGMGPAFGWIRNNSDTVRAFANCGINYDLASTNIALTVNYDDAHNGATDFESLWCQPLTCNASGSSCTNQTPVLHSCATAGGCTSHSAGFTGAGTLGDGAGGAGTHWKSLTRTANSFHALNCAIPRSNAGSKSRLLALKVNY